MEPKFKVDDVVTLEGDYRSYRVVYFDVQAKDYLLAAVRQNGKLEGDTEWRDESDITLVPPPRVTYVNFDADGMTTIHPSRSAADDCSYPDRMACMRVACVAGQFDE